jgi:hypothetical protein
MKTSDAAAVPDKSEPPTAAQLYTLLQAGTSCTVNGHTLTLDEHGVWITNPYGNDGLWQELTIERIEKFLTDMAANEEYGLVP